MRNLGFEFRGDTLIVSVEKELSYCFHKTTLNVDEKDTKRAADQVASQVKYIKGFKRFSLTFGTIDWYSSCSDFDVPYFVCTNENKRIKAGYNTFNDIPKDWTENYNLFLEIPDTVRGLNKFFDALKINLSDAQLNQVRKAIKDKKYLQFEIN